MGGYAVFLKKCLWFETESSFCFAPKSVGGILGERTFCVFRKEKIVELLKRRKHFSLELKSVGGILSERIFCF